MSKRKTTRWRTALLYLAMLIPAWSLLIFPSSPPFYFDTPWSTFEVVAWLAVLVPFTVWAVVHTSMGDDV